jgi:hypothetical protein
MARFSPGKALGESEVGVVDAGIAHAVRRAPDRPSGNGKAAVLNHWEGSGELGFNDVHALHRRRQ